jgi:translation elongation factor EF-G
MEPLMFVKVNARREYLDPLMQALRARGARMHEVELQGRRVLLRAEARLAMLLGFEAAVLATSRQSAQVHARLVRYEPMLAAGVGAARE